jgi:pyrroloquinoline-quinone synthase
MKFVEKLNLDLDKYHLLKHPFYQAWSNGELSQETLAIYAREYYHHVAAFPRYISAIHSYCDEITHRQVLLGNLIEEEQGDKNHPALWIQFAKGLGCSEAVTKSPAKFEATQKLVEGYFDLVRGNFAKGLGALYAYERQTPEVSLSKIEGLKQFYNISNPETLEFFTVHAEADEWHSEECANILEAIKEEDQSKADEGAMTGAKLLWQFLDKMQEMHESNIH